MFQLGSLETLGGLDLRRNGLPDRTLFVQAVPDLVEVAVHPNPEEMMDLRSIQDRFLKTVPPETSATPAVNPDLGIDEGITQRAKDNLEARRLAEGRSMPMTWQETEDYIEALSIEKSRLLLVRAAKVLNQSYDPGRPHRHLREGPNSLLRLIVSDASIAQ